MSGGCSQGSREEPLTVDSVREKSARERQRAVSAMLLSEGLELVLPTRSRLVVEKRFEPSGPALRQLLESRL